jgi:hypothetical protein
MDRAILRRSAEFAARPPLREARMERRAEPAGVRRAGRVARARLEAVRVDESPELGARVSRGARPPA